MERAAAFKRTVERSHSRIQELQSYTDSLFQGVFSLRFRWVGGLGAGVSGWSGDCGCGCVGRLQWCLPVQRHSRGSGGRCRHGRVGTAMVLVASWHAPCQHDGAAPGGITCCSRLSRVGAPGCGVTPAC